MSDLPRSLGQTPLALVEVAARVALSIHFYGGSDYIQALVCLCSELPFKWTETCTHSPLSDADRGIGDMDTKPIQYINASESADPKFDAWMVNGKHYSDSWPQFLKPTEPLQTTSKNVKLFVRPKRKAIYPSVSHNADKGLGKGAGADVRT